MPKVIHDKGEFEISKPEDLKRLVDLVEPGVPVMVENSHYSSDVWGGHRTNQILFFAGKFANGNFVPRQMKGLSRAVVTASGKDGLKEHYRLHCPNSDQVHGAEIVMPWSNVGTAYNEGTFSPAGGTSWAVFSNGGTGRIILGKKVEEEFGTALDAVRFAERAVNFQLPPMYSMPGYLIRSGGMNNQAHNIRERESSKLVCVSAAYNLLKRAAGSMEGFSDELHVNQLSFYQSAGGPLRKAGYPVADEDYIVAELSHPCRTLAVVKVGRGHTYGDSFVLPLKHGGELCKRAFSEEMIARYYPGDRPEKK